MWRTFLAISFYTDAFCGNLGGPTIYGAINSNFSTFVWDTSVSVLQSEANLSAVPAWCVDDSIFNIWLNAPAHVSVLDSHLHTFTTNPGLVVSAFNDTCVQNLSKTTYWNPFPFDSSPFFSIKPIVLTLDYCIKPQVVLPSLQTQHTQTRCDSCSDGAYYFLYFVAASLGFFVLVTVFLTLYKREDY